MDATGGGAWFSDCVRRHGHFKLIIYKKQFF